MKENDILYRKAYIYLHGSTVHWPRSWSHMTPRTRPSQQMLSAIPGAMNGNLFADEVNLSVTGWMTRRYTNIVGKYGLPCRPA